MKRIITVALSALTFTALAVAGSPVAAITSAQSFVLDGHAVETPGVTKWPAVVGDDVQSSAAGPLLLTFRDGSSVKLGPASRVKLSGSDQQPKLVLVAGSLDYKLVLGSKLSVTNLDLERQPAVAPAAPEAQTAPLSSRSGKSIGAIAAVGGAGLAAAVPMFLIPSTNATTGQLTAAPTLLTVPPVSRSN